MACFKMFIIRRGARMSVTNYKITPGENYIFYNVLAKVKQIEFSFTVYIPKT